jgi:hypothetical protein
MSVHVRPAALQDGVAVLQLLEDVGYYPEPISFAQTYRKTLANPHFLVRVAEEDGRIVGVGTLSLRYQLGLGGLLACLDELAVAPGPSAPRVHKGAAHRDPRQRGHAAAARPSARPGRRGPGRQAKRHGSLTEVYSSPSASLGGGPVVARPAPPIIGDRPR